MYRVIFVALAALAGAACGTASGTAVQADTMPVVEVFKTPTCGCCSKWVEHMQANGFEVRTTDLESLGELKAKHGVPAQLQSCHTSLVGGYVVEGHVPAADVRRLLTEKPAVAGIAVPGMPVGSPGMEYPGVNPQRYDVIAFEKSGQGRVFARH